jgi:hypothetical protein
MDWWSWFYQSPTWLSCIAFVLVVVIISLIGSLLYSWSCLGKYQCSESSNGTISIFLSMIALFLGVTVALIITQANANYNEAIFNASQEASNIYTLYMQVSSLKYGDALANEVFEYLVYIINEEYPALKVGDLPERGYDLIDSLTRNIINYGPRADSPTEQTLWASAMSTMSSIQQQRVSRLAEASYGVNNILFWITVIEAMILLVLSWFIECSTWFKYVYVGLVAIYIGAAIYVMIVLPYPFLGYNAITPAPFEQVYSQITGGPAVITTIPYCGRGHKVPGHKPRTSSLITYRRRKPKSQ